MGKNKSIQDIFQIIKRQNNSYYNFSIKELESLLKLVESFKKNEYSILSYIPIKLVTILECYFKEIVQQFVDYDVKYANTLISYLKDIRVDMDFITILSGKLITIGNIISQLVSVQRVDSFLDIMKKFTEKLEKKYDSYLSQNDLKITLYELKKSLLNLNNQRNVIVHENSSLSINLDQLVLYIEHTKLFLNATNYIVEQLLYSNLPTYQFEINQSVYDKSEILDKKTRKLIAKICVYIRSKRGNKEVRQFLKYYHQREKSIDEYGNLKSEFYEGGSMAPLIYWSAVTEARENFFSELRLEFLNSDGEIQVHPLDF